jgi:hypothetical protein
VKKTVLLYGAIGGVLIAALKLIEYRYLVVEHSLEIYGGLVALIFSTVGIWLGLRLTTTKETIVVHDVPVLIAVGLPVFATVRGKYGTTCAVRDCAARARDSRTDGRRIEQS